MDPFDDSLNGWFSGREFKQFLLGLDNIPHTTTWTEANRLARENPEKYAVWRARKVLGVRDD